MNIEKNSIVATLSIVAMLATLIWSTLRVYPLLTSGSDTSKAEFYALVVAVGIIIYICVEVFRVKNTIKQTASDLYSRVTSEYKEHIAFEIKTIDLYIINTTKLFEKMDENIGKTLEKIEKANDRANERNDKTNGRIDELLERLPTISPLSH